MDTHTGNQNSVSPY